MAMDPEKMMKMKMAKDMMPEQKSTPAEAPKLDAFSSVENKHNSPNTHEFYLRKQWAGRYVGQEEPTVGKINMTGAISKK